MDCAVLFLRQLLLLVFDNFVLAAIRIDKSINSKRAKGGVVKLQESYGWKLPCKQWILVSYPLWLRNERNHCEQAVRSVMIQGRIN